MPRTVSLGAGGKLVAVMLLVACLFSLEAAASEPVDFEIPAQPLEQALEAFAVQSQRQVTVDADAVRDLQGAAVFGRLTPESALAELTAGSGLRLVALNNADFALQAAPVAAAPPPVVDSASFVEEMVVYGQKRAESLQETTASVLVFGEAITQNLTFTEMTDLYRFAPNVNVDDSGEGTFLIRGISFSGVGFAGVSNTASLYVDDIFQSNLGIEAGPLATFDVEQVEFFRGPQSTLQGRNALAGAIFVRTADPTYDWSARGRIEAAEYNTQRYSFAFGGPIVDQQLAFRASVDYRETDGFITNTTLDRDDVDRDETVNARAKLLWEPTERFDARLTYLYTEGFAGTSFGTGGVQGPDFFEREVTYDNVTLLDINTNNWALNLGYDLNDSVRFELVTTYTDAKEDSAPRFPQDPDDPNRDVGSDREQIFTADLRARLVSNRWDVLMGLYYFDKEQARDRDLQAFLTAGPFSTNFRFVELSARDVENYAVYLDGQFSIVERLSLLFGIRYDNERFEIASQTSTFLDPEIPPLGLFSSVGGELVANTTFDAILPKLGLRWDFADNQNIGFVVQRGYRPGGAGTSLSNDEFTFGPEYVWNYEFSYRSSWLRDRLQLNANLFYTDWTDQQALIGADLDAIIVNAGESRLYGFEAELFYRPIDSLTLFAAVGTNDTEFTDFNDVDPTLTGNRFPSA
ncbi:MAG: TonB-dependent receptor, partial [Pseudomonadota bacterium]